jgi:hypothetical protein
MNKKLMFPQVKKRNHGLMRRLESHEQEKIFALACCHPILKKYLISIPNGGYRHIIEARNLKKQGVKSGVSDMFLAYPNKTYHGLWLELKRDAKSKVSAAQKEWIELMQSVGYSADVAYGFDDAIRKLINYINHK